MTLTCRRIPRCCCQFLQQGTKQRERSSRWFSAGEERTKQALAMSRNGVVGSTGKAAPKTCEHRRTDIRRRHMRPAELRWQPSRSLVLHVLAFAFGLPRPQHHAELYYNRPAGIASTRRNSSR